MRRDLDGAQICDMIGGVIGLVGAGGDAVAGLFGLGDLGIASYDSARNMIASAMQEGNLNVAPSFTTA